MIEHISLCPWCKSSKIMCEGNESRIAMVCQKCLARGPEVPVSAGRYLALKEWNSRKSGKFSKVTCPVCKRLCAVAEFGLWPHRNYWDGGTCKGSRMKV